MIYYISYIKWKSSFISIIMTDLMMMYVRKTNFHIDADLLAREPIRNRAFGSNFEFFYQLLKNSRILTGWWQILRTNYLGWRGNVLSPTSSMSPIKIIVINTNITSAYTPDIYSGWPPILWGPIDPCCSSVAFNLRSPGN